MFQNSEDRAHQASLDNALNGLDILKDVHLVLAPLRPTKEMIDAARSLAPLTPMQAQLIYEAMVRASLPALTGEDIF